MRGQGRQKKMKGGPSLGGDGGGNDARGGGVGGTDNLPGNQKHPLLNELVMEVLFKQYTLLNHDDSAKSALARLAELREVCKAWNQEIGKITRKETRINIKRLISSYPKGLGWEVTATEDQDDMEFKYSSPMPQEIGPFENLDVKIKTCQDFSNTSVIEWFQLMGSSVKSLRLTCTLNCYHQNRFIEKVLKEWCPNLVSFTLGGVKCYESLVENSCFAEASLDSQCSSLKEFVLCVEKAYRDCRSKCCDLRINQLEGMTGGPSRTGMKTSVQLFDFVKDLINYLDAADEDWSGQFHENNLLTKLVRRPRRPRRPVAWSRPIGLASLNGMEPRTFGSHVAGFFQENFSCDSGYETDGGIFGQLIKMSRVKRFVIKDPGINSDLFFDFLAAMLFFRRNFWRESLESFECVGNCPVISSNGRYPKNIFPKVGVPLKKIKLVDVMPLEDAVIMETGFQRMFRGNAESLEELEIKLKTFRLHGLTTQFPGLPKLKVLVVECEAAYRMVKVTIWDVLEKFPMLERCELKLGLKGQTKRNIFFGNEQDNVVGGREWGNFGSHPLKELKVLDEYVDGKGIESVVTWFPSLKKVELSIVRKSEESFQTFWGRMKELSLEEVKVSFAARLRRNEGNGLWEKAIGDNVGEFKDLEWLELVHEAGQPFQLTSDLSKEFGKVEKLRFLKFTNFEMKFRGRLTGNEAQEIKENLANIVVDYAGV